MRNNMIYPLIVGMCLMALGASGKAIIDVAVLTSENVTIKTLLMEVRNDVKTLLGEKHGK